MSDGFNSEGVREKDGVVAILAGAVPERFLSSDIPFGLGVQEPLLVGGFDQLIVKDSKLDAQIWNLIKKCPQCGKPCAVSMIACNACGTDLVPVEISKAPNLFMGFIFGVDKAGFPLKISMRLEAESMIVFDDPLAITRAHVLATPTHMHIPDIRSLFVDPSAALKILADMERAAWAALSTTHLADPAWCEQNLSAEGRALSKEDLRSRVVGAFNLPPSQFQLHLQYMLPPMLPHHVSIFMKGAHFVKHRHFPLAFVQEGLKALVAAGKSLPDAPKMEAQDLVKALGELKVDYDAMYAEDMAALGRNNTLLANFKSEDFKYAIIDGKVCYKDGSALDSAPLPKEVEAADKLSLQSYGRPYSADGKPGGKYYKYARAPAVLPTLG